MIRYGILATLALVACGGEQPEPVAFCNIVTRRPIIAEYVRVEAVGIFSDHGAVLKHPDCPTLSAEWHEANAFENDASRTALLAAIHDLRLDLTPTSLDPEDLEVDLTAHYRWRNGRPEVVVEKVHAVRRVPTVYASEFERNFTRCEMGPLPGPRSEEWHAACDATEEWLRVERQRNNN